MNFYPFIFQHLDQKRLEVKAQGAVTQDETLKNREKLRTNAPIKCHAAPA